MIFPPPNPRTCQIKEVNNPLWLVTHEDGSMSWAESLERAFKYWKEGSDHRVDVTKYRIETEDQQV